MACSPFNTLGHALTNASWHLLAKQIPAGILKYNGGRKRGNGEDEGGKEDSELALCDYSLEAFHA